MRLLDTHSLVPRLFSGDLVPPYAILSHTWNEGEVEYRHLKRRPHAGGLSPATQKRQGFAKVLQSARIAASYGYDYVWINACCIDKASSAEHKESINSMCKWYQGASMCIIYLEDVDSQEEPTLKDLRKSFMHAKWFTRGWTLQELIASRGRVFFDKKWGNLNAIVGHDKLLHWVHQRTSIPVDVLTGQAGLEKVNIATKMRWAAHRETTREEDTAYALVGIFDVHMSPHYGEGRVKAFIRLQRKILKSSSDHTIFAWSRPRHHTGQWTGLLAASPDWFDVPNIDCSLMKPYHLEESFETSPWSMTNVGLEVSLHFEAVQDGPDTLRAYLPISDPANKTFPSFLLYCRGGNKYTRDENLLCRPLPRQLTKREIVVPQEDAASGRAGSVPTITLRNLCHDAWSFSPVSVVGEWTTKERSVVCASMEERGGLRFASMRIGPPGIATAEPNRNEQPGLGRRNMPPDAVASTAPEAYSIFVFLRCDIGSGRWLLSCCVTHPYDDALIRPQWLNDARRVAAVTNELAVSFNAAHAFDADNIEIDVSWRGSLGIPPGGGRYPRSEDYPLNSRWGDSDDEDDYATEISNPFLAQGGRPYLGDETRPPRWSLPSVVPGALDAHPNLQPGPPSRHPQASSGRTTATIAPPHAPVPPGLATPYMSSSHQVGYPIPRPPTHPIPPNLSYRLEGPQPPPPFAHGPGSGPSAPPSLLAHRTRSSAPGLTARPSLPQLAPRAKTATSGLTAKPSLPQLSSRAKSSAPRPVGLQKSQERDRHLTKRNLTPLDI